MSSKSSLSSNMDRDADLLDKKRRKPSVTSEPATQPKTSSSNNNVTSGNTAAKEDVYANVVRFEKQESEHRSADADSGLFHDTFAELRTLFAEIAQQQLKAVKAGGSVAEKIRAELNEKRIECSYMFVLMKKLNRMDKIRLRSGRDALHKEKLSVDSNRLQLQNLLYEAEHLRKEVQRCLQFKSQDEQIELVDEEQFYANAPEDISRPEKTRGDEHARRLARLDWELQQRKELAAMCEQLQRQKELAAQHIESKTQCLDSLAPRLDALLKATRPVQEALNMHIEDEWKVHKIARLLPPPLYMAYANLSALAETCDPHLFTTINGDEFEAKQLNGDTSDDVSVTQSLKSKSSTQDEDEAMESDNEDEEPRPSKKSHHHRRQSKTAHADTRREHLFKPHPLSVTFRIQARSSDAAATQNRSLCVTLYYLPTLNLITAKIALHADDQPPAINSDVIAPATILNCLSAGDVGVESANPKTFYQMRERDMNPGSFASLLEAKDLGKPYRWAQQLCGLEFVSNTAGVSLELTQVAVPQIVRQIRERWQNRLELLSHIEPFIQFNATATPASPSDASLVKWSAIAWPEYVGQPATKRFVDIRVVDSEDLLYSVVIARGSSARLDCAVRVSVEHPLKMPLWAITLNRKDTVHTAQTNAIVREIESWVNDATQPSDRVLEHQLHRARSCLDIYLETEGDGSEFKQEKTFLRAFRTRTRSRPFKEIQSGTSTVYTQVV